ncbi:GNAT family N-acetyltransferase [Actinomadura rupiterrae]|uniref:GNAT family N-acetyltransferase n=1 Tax=Actinomadura rupiterrae TaxID=559627 RepID=UPI0020A2CA57|nr:GNAT family N-acetyltransferase [Actinomadura rupiterrae]MCP2340865.1 putative acetyltransferase [Actinomadura rupiterrae]
MEIRDVTTADLDAVLDNRVRAFGPVDEDEVRSWRHRADLVLPEGREIAGWDGDHLVATTRIWKFRQWWQGRAVPTGGVAGVTVAPEDRGRGAGRKIVTAALQRSIERGDVLAALHPATTAFYRGLGFEHAGGMHKITMPAEVLRGLSAERVEVHRATPDDAELVAETIARVHRDARDSGPMDRGGAYWRVVLADEKPFAYLAEDGVLIYRWSKDGSALEVERLVAGSERTARGLWAIVGSGASTAETVRAHLAPYDPVLWLVGEREHDMIDRTQWMLRVLDAPKAVELRGYRPGVSAEIPVRIEDDLVTANTGDWTLTVKDGEGRLEPASEDPAAVRVGPRGLAALYAGVPLSTLRRSGLLHGGDIRSEALDSVFGAQPFALDYY